MRATKARQISHDKSAGNDRIAAKIANYFALKWSKIHTQQRAQNSQI